MGWIGLLRYQNDRRRLRNPSSFELSRSHLRSSRRPCRNQNVHFVNSSPVSRSFAIRTPSQRYSTVLKAFYLPSRWTLVKLTSLNADSYLSSWRLIVVPNILYFIPHPGVKVTKHVFNIAPRRQICAPFVPSPSMALLERQCCQSLVARRHQSAEQRILSGNISDNPIAWLKNDSLKTLQRPWTEERSRILAWLLASFFHLSQFLMWWLPSSAHKHNGIDSLL